MEYTFDDIKKIIGEYSMMNRAIIKKIKEIGEKINFFDKYWYFENYEIDFEEEKINITAYDAYYDGYDTKSTSIPINWLFDSNWFEEYKIEKEKEEEKEKEKQLKIKEQEEKKEYETYLKLQEKYGNVERN